jgi:hypothetical protein
LTTIKTNAFSRLAFHRNSLADKVKWFSAETTKTTSFLKNGLVDISLIDAPGLNRDTLSTTALFARQSDTP